MYFYVSNLITKYQGTFDWNWYTNYLVITSFFCWDFILYKWFYISFLSGTLFFMLRGMLFNHNHVLFFFFFFFHGFFIFFHIWVLIFLIFVCPVLSCCHRNSQSSTYELFLIQIGGIKVQPCKVWTLSGLRFLTDSWLIENPLYPRLR